MVCGFNNGGLKCGKALEEDLLYGHFSICLFAEKMVAKRITFIWVRGLTGVRFGFRDQGSNPIECQITENTANTISFAHGFFIEHDTVGIN